MTGASPSYSTSINLFHILLHSTLTYLMGILAAFYMNTLIFFLFATLIPLRLIFGISLLPSPVPRLMLFSSQTHNQVHTFTVTLHSSHLSSTTRVLSPYTHTLTLVLHPPSRATFLCPLQSLFLPSSSGHVVHFK